MGGGRVVSLANRTEKPRTRISSFDWARALSSGPKSYYRKKNPDDNSGGGGFTKKHSREGG